MGIFSIYMYVCTSLFQMCHLGLYQTHIITLATIYMEKCLYKCKDSNVLAYIVKIQSTVIIILL